MHLWPHRLPRLVAQGAGIAFLSLALIEVALQVSAALVTDRAGSGWRPGSEIRVLAVGDSHTYGGSVPRGQDYPHQLQRFLDATEPGLYSVVNVGVPGFNTSQVRNRLGVNLARWRPDIVVLWCGVNNLWNNAERASTDPTTALDTWALRLRTYKLVRVWLHDRQLAAGVRRDVEGGRHRLVPLGADGHEIPFFGEVFAERLPDLQLDQATEDWVTADLEAIVQLVRNAGVDVVLITYPLETHFRYVVPNRAIQRAAEDLEVPVVRGLEGYERVPESVGRLSWALHPSGPVYGEIARDVARQITSLRQP